MSQDLREELQGNSERSQPTETQDDAEARDDFWSIEGDFIFRRHTEPRVHLYVPKEESFPIPLKYIDATRTTRTSSDVLQEKRAHDCCNVDVDRTLSDSWTGCTKFTWLNEKPPPGYMWSGRRLTQIQAATRPDYFWPEIWIGMSEAARKKGDARVGNWETKARQRSKTERHLFPRSGRWGVQGHHQKRNEKLEVPMEAAVLHQLITKTRSKKVRETDSETKESNKIQKTKYACIVEAHETTRKRLESTVPRNNQKSWGSHIGKRVLFNDSLQFGAHIYSHATSNEKSGCKKLQYNGRSSRTCQHGKWRQGKEQERCQKEKKKVHFATSMDICHLKNAELESKHPKYKGRVVLRGDIVKDDSGACAVFTEQGSSASQMTAA